MKNVDIKTLTLCFALNCAVSNVCFADTISVEASSVNAPAKGQSLPTSVSKPNTVSCPAQFQQVKIARDARQCQSFDESMTAVMVYHSPAEPGALVNLYQTAHPALKAHSPVNGRTLLSSSDKAIRVIVSPDKTGSQVDILVTSKSK